ncbi:MAG: hypothetical protein HFG22_02200 [Lachnospiraceae bacterium]|nr:hypothetical protein [Lachnospiraceae bacterium]
MEKKQRRGRYGEMEEDEGRFFCLYGHGGVGGQFFGTCGYAGPDDST